MEKNNDSSKPNDFASNNFIQRNQHNRDISSLKRRLDELEKRVGNDAVFASSFESASRNSKVLNDSVNAIIDNYDRHLLWAKGTALIKWLAVVTLGALIGWFMNQSLSIPKYNSEIEAMKQQFETIKQQSE